MELEISQATAIKNSDFGLMHMDKLPSGSWRLIFSEDIATDFSTIESFTMLREG
jgi:hypothetical protein